MSCKRESICTQYTKGNRRKNKKNHIEATLEMQEFESIHNITNSQFTRNRKNPQILNRPLYFQLQEVLF